MHPAEILQGYRLGGHQATVELQKAGAPDIHIDFDALKLVASVQVGEIRSVILTGTAGDGKTYLAYRVIEALELDRNQVNAAQKEGGYRQNGVYIDLDLSAGPLDQARVERLHRALSAPARLTLVCANEGKLSELEEKFQQAGLDIPSTPLRVNLSRRALVNTEAWNKVLHGVLEADFWAEARLPETHVLARNRDWLQDPIVKESVRSYLLLPYLLGEPITVRESLSFIAYILTGDLSSEDGERISTDARKNLDYFLFNTLFSQPEGYVHGGRAVPGEKLLWWMFRFDPGATANPQTDLKLLTRLDQLEVKPPEELCAYWRAELVAQTDESSDVAYRQRVTTFMRYARRWYALFSKAGRAAYFPFRYLGDYVAALSLAPKELEDQIPQLIKGLNLLLSGGQVTQEFDLCLYHISDLSTARQSVIYSNIQLGFDKFQLISDLSLESTTADAYLERHPRSLYLCYPGNADPHKQARLPVSLLLYEVLMGASSPQAGFPATLWSKERHTVARFMGALNRLVEKPAIGQFVIAVGADKQLKLVHHSKQNKIILS